MGLLRGDRSRVVGNTEVDQLAFSLMLERAWLLFEQRRYGDALELAQRSLQQAPNQARAYALIAQCHRKLGQLPLGLEAAQRVIQIAPDAALGYHVTTMLHCSLKQYDAAQRSLEQAIKRSPDNDALHYLAGAIAFDQERWQDCLDSTAQALQSNPEHVSSLILRGRCFLKQWRLEEVQQLVSLALSLKGNSSDAHALLGHLQLKQRAFDAALKSFRIALEQDPHNAFAHDGLIDAMMAQNWLYRKISWLHSPQGLVLLALGLVVTFVGSLLLIPQMSEGRMLWGAIFPYSFMALIGLSFLPLITQMVMQLVMLLKPRERLLFSRKAIIIMIAFPVLIGFVLLTVISESPVLLCLFGLIQSTSFVMALYCGIKGK